MIPATIGKVPGADAKVTGWTAGSEDFNDTMKAHAPIVFAFVLGLAFVLLLSRSARSSSRSRRSCSTCSRSARPTACSSWSSSRATSSRCCDFTSIGGVTDWLPLFLFVILFGLSMDYHVLILSRVRESYDRHEHRRRRRSRHPRDRGVVTSAAIVMVAVFAIFATLGMLDFKMMGVGLAVAVLSTRRSSARCCCRRR